MLARALVGAPRVLVVDEPLAGLDPRHMLDSLRRLRDCALRDGMLVIASVHDLNLALRHATRLWVLHEGRLVADGEPARVLDAGLLGRVFQVAGCVSGEGSRAWIDYA
jgi:iron complex transport system ATP-binding protein